MTMRVLSGRARGKKLLSVTSKGTRPILSRVRAAVFDIIRPQLAEAHFLDLFAGTGSVGIEALSQGASRCVFLDLSDEAVSVIKKNLENCGFADMGEVRHTDAFSYLKSTRKQFDIIYVAPPQYEGLWIEAMRVIAERPSLLTERGFVIVQIDPSEYEALSLEELEEVRQKRYGNTLLVFFEQKGAVALGGDDLEEEQSSPEEDHDE